MTTSSRSGGARSGRSAPGEPSPTLIRAVTRLARPLVRLLIARGISLPYLTNLLKTVYVSVAEESFGDDRDAATVSRLSVITGLQRKDIKRIQTEPPPDQAPPPSVSLGARLIGIWTGDARFRARKGGPAPLPRVSEDPKKPSFDDLVRTVSSDVRPRVILDEWLRLGIVAVDPDGLIRLNSDAFVPQEGFDEKAYYLGRNVADHIATSVHNLLGDGAPLFERAVYYDKLTPESLAHLRKRARELGMTALLALNKDALKRADQDADKPDAHNRMALGLYYFEGPDEDPSGSRVDMAFRHAALGLALLLATSATAIAADYGICRFAPREGRGSTSDALQKLVSSRAELNEQRGLGGTGVIARGEERGLGGTGIIGVVTGFGSVCVNGYEVDIDGKTEVNVEGVPAKRGDVKLGQLVEIEAYANQDTMVAARVSVRVAVAGPIESIAEDRSTLVVAGQTVSAAGFGPNVKLPRMKAGDWVAVSGLRRADGSILGSAITRLKQGERVLVSGELQTSDNGQLRLGGLTVDGTGLTAGQHVVVRGELAATTLISRETRVDRGSPFSSGVRALSVQADAARVEAELSRVSGTAVRLNDDLVRNAASAGVAVQADGRLDVKRSQHRV